MSFSSTSTLASAPGSANSSATSPPSSNSSSPPDAKTSSAPDYKRLERILVSLIALARSTYSPRKHRSPTYHARQYDQYTRVHARLTSFFAQPAHRDAGEFVRSGTWGFVLEMGILVSLVEVALGVKHVGVEGMPVVGEAKGKVVKGFGAGEECERNVVMIVAQDERKTVERRVNTDVEWLIFQGAELDCERLPWNLGSIGGEVANVSGAQ